MATSNPKISPSLLTILAGIILPFAFAPYGYYLVAEVALLFLLLSWHNATPGRAFWYGWLFGITFFSCGIYWIYISIHHYGHAPIALTLLILALLICFLSLYFALQGYLLNRFYPQNDWRKFLLAFPASFALAEGVRGWLFGGFPWLFLGYGHVDAPLRGWATIFGVYGVTFAIAQTAGAIFCLYYYRKNKKTLILLALLIAALWGGGSYLATINWTKKSGEQIRVSLIQGNIGQDRKWYSEELWPIISEYTALTDATHYASKIIVWPEAAIPTYSENVKVYLKTLSATAKKHGTTILTGVPFRESIDNGKNTYYYNGILAFGASDGKYYKRQLVPFGEYFPCKFILNQLRDFIQIPMSDFSNGSKNQPDLFAGNILLAPFICYEISYPELVLDYLPKAGLLVTISDDSWFGKSIEAEQHLEIARMRSLEVARYQLLGTNTGITAIIDAHGKIIAKAPSFKPATLNASVTNLTGSTPWVRFGKYLWIPLLLRGLWIARRKKTT